MRPWRLCSLLLLALPFVGSCDLFASPCRELCSYNTDCMPEQLEDAGAYGDCEWEDDDRDVLKECMDACKDEWKKSSSSDREEFATCIRCFHDEVDGSCDSDDLTESMYDDCEDECDDDEVLDFFEDVYEEWNWEIECDYGAGGDTGLWGGFDGTTEATSGTSPTPEPLLIDSVQVACNTDGNWQVDAMTSTWTGDAVYNAWEVLPKAAGWNEEHTLPSISFEPDGGPDTLQAILTPGAAVGDHTPGTNTVFVCGTHDVSDAMVYAIRVYDVDLAYADCAIWGEADKVEQVLTDGDDVSAHNTISNPEELESCVVF